MLLKNKICFFQKNMLYFKNKNGGFKNEKNLYG